MEISPTVSDFSPRELHNKYTSLVTKEEGKKNSKSKIISMTRMLMIASGPLPWDWISSQLITT